MGGSGLKAWSNVAGSLLPSCESVGVASLAPTFLNATSAETVVQTRGKLTDKLMQSSLNHRNSTDLADTKAKLKAVIKRQNKILCALVTNSNQLRAVQEKSKSSQIKEAIDQIIDTAEELFTQKDSLHSAY